MSGILRLLGTKPQTRPKIIIIAKSLQTQKKKRFRVFALGHLNYAQRL